jgi:hypothetical protein
MTDFSLDHKEYFLIDHYATAHQQRYGLPNYNEVNWTSREVPWGKHLEKINENVYGTRACVKTTIPKPKEKHSVTMKEKLEITNNNI